MGDAMRPYQRSTSIKKIIKKVGKGTSTHFRRKKKGKHKDAFKNLTKQGASRPFGGVLSHSVLERVVRYAVRLKKGFISLNDVPIKLRNFVSRMVERL